VVWFNAVLVVLISECEPVVVLDCDGKVELRPEDPGVASFATVMLLCPWVGRGRAGRLLVGATVEAAGLLDGTWAAVALGKEYEIVSGSKEGVGEGSVSSFGFDKGFLSGDV
jgi:hypothetical protein